MRVQTDFEEGGHNPRVLADGPVPLGAHTAVDENLRDRIPSGRRFFALVGARQAADKVHGVVVTDELQRRGNAGDEIFLSNDGHGVFF